MNRYFLDADRWGQENLILQGDEAKHCQQIMRTAVGDKIEIFDGKGCSAVCVVDRASKREVVAKIEGIINQEAASACPMILAQAIPKGKNMELIIQKAVELGVTKIIPLITENTVARAGDAKKKQEKWQRVSLEACKQCGQNWMPEILATQDFSEFISIRKQMNDGLHIAGAILPEMMTMKKALLFEKMPDFVELLVGPEGDFSEEEYQQIIESSFVGASLGNLILRSETAALFMISAAKAQLDG